MQHDRQGTGTDSQHLQTEHLLTNLEGRTLSSGVVTVASQAAQFVFNLGSIMALARLLNPADFGLVAMFMTIMGFLRVFKEVGLSTATIQREGITHAQVSNLFWINTAVSSAVGVMLAGASPLIAWFYREPRLIPITLVLSCTLPLSGLTVQHTALLTRQMRFKVLACIQVISQVIGIAVGIGMAWKGYGYWALVGLNLGASLTTVVLTYVAVPWRPQAPSRGSGTRPLVSFGAHLAAGGLVYSVARGSDGLLIGRTYGSDAVGLYSRAAALLNRPSEQILGAIESVFIPMLSRVQTQADRYRSTFLQFYSALALIGALFTGLLFALARPITLLVLGPKWEQASVIFAGFALSALCTPVSTASTWLFATQGRGKGMLLASILLSGISLASVVVGLPFGAAGVALAQSAIGLAIGLPTLFYLAGRQGPVTTSDLWIGFLHCVPLWAVVGGTAFLVSRGISEHRPLVQVALCTPPALLAGALVIAISSPLRHTAQGVYTLVRRLVLRESVG